MSFRRERPECPVKEGWGLRRTSTSVSATSTPVLTALICGKRGSSLKDRQEKGGSDSWQREQISEQDFAGARWS